VRQHDKSRWVGHSPAIGPNIGRLYDVFPDLTFVHVVRDGRETVTAGRTDRALRSLSHRKIERQIADWRDSVIATYRAMLRVPPERWMTVQWGSFTGADALAHYEELLEFLQIYDSPRMRAHFVTKVLPSRQRSMTWRAGLNPQEQKDLTAVYEQALAELESAGVPLPLPAD
jgi:hypothetical protein